MLITILTFVILLSVLIFIHELGHFLAAKRASVRVEEFGFGYPPRLWSKKVGETIYSLNLLPIGGFVRLTGEEGDLPGTVRDESETPSAPAEMKQPFREIIVEEEYLEAQVNGDRIVAEIEEIEIAQLPRSSDYLEGSIEPLVDPKSFANQTNFVKTSILTSGVLMNFFLGVVLVGIVFAFLGVPEIKNVIELSEVVPGAPAAQGGLAAGDLILGYNGTNVTNSEKFVEFINENLGEEVMLRVDREEEVQCVRAPCSLRKIQVEVVVTPRVEPPEGEGSLGIVFVVVPEISYHKISLWQVPWQAVSESLKLTGLMFGGVVRIFKDLVMAGEVPKDITGPVGIARLTGEVAKQGFFQVVNFAALLSINLGVINILPFPGLDGGRLSFVLAEVVLRRKIKAKYQKWVHTIGIAALLLLMLIVTFYDILRFL